MSITDTTPGTVVPFQRPDAGRQVKPGTATNASTLALAEKALAVLSVCDNAQAEAWLAVGTLRAVASSNRHGAERMWLFDIVMEKVAAMKERAKHVPRPPSFFRNSIWFDEIFKPIDATLILLTETIDRDSERTLRINLAAKLEKLLQEVDELTHRIAAGWEHHAKAVEGSVQ